MRNHANRARSSAPHPVTLAKARRIPALRRRAALGVIVLLAVLIVLVLGPRKRPSPALPARGEDPGAAIEAPVPHGVAHASAAGAAPAEPAPIIDEIRVEKSAVCAGEDNLVRVRAHTSNATDEFLSYVINGEHGAAVPVRLELDDHGNVSGKHFVEVFGRNGAVTVVPLPEYKVKPCRLTHVGLVQATLRSNTWGAYDFVAKAVTSSPRAGLKLVGPEGPFVPVRYSWSFGDGETQTTQVPTASHDYEGREQASKYSYFDVRVDMYDEHGEKLTGRISLAQINAAFMALSQKGIVQLLIALDPRFPELDDRGRVVEHVHLWQTSGESVTVKGIAMTKYAKRGSGESRPQSVDPIELLGTTTIPPGKDGVTATALLDTTSDPDVFSVTYRVSGTSASGKPAMGSFSVMRPPPRPTADNSKPILDPMLKAKIHAARVLLQKDVVNDEDLARLSREGKFAHLAPSLEDRVTASAK
jgi:hypothetical protein